MLLEKVHIAEGAQAIPEELVSELLKNNEPARISEVADALSITVLRAKGTSCLGKFKSRALCRMIVSSPKEFARVFRSFPSTETIVNDAFYILSRKSVYSAFMEDPKKMAAALAKTGSSAGYCAGMAFTLLGRKALCPKFARNPLEIAAAIARICDSAESRRKEALELLSSNSALASFAKSPREFSAIIETAGVSPKEAFRLLGKKLMAEAFRANPERISKLLVKIGKSAGSDVHYAFHCLCIAPVTDAFCKDPEGITALLIGLSKLAGPCAGGAFYLLGKKGIANAFKAGPEFIISNLSRALKNSGGEANMGYALSLLANKHINPLFAKNPKEFTDSLVRILRAAKKNAFQAIWALYEHAEEFASNPKRIERIFVQISGISGRSRRKVFDLMRNEHAVSAFGGDLETFVKLAEASAYSRAIYRLEKFCDEEDTASMEKMARLLGDPDAMAEEYGIETLKDYRGSWREGRKLARAAGCSVEDREVFTNFAYAIDAIGEERAIAIHREYGIEYFARYSKKELRNLHRSIRRGRSRKPLLLISYCKSDHRGSYYFRLPKREKLWDEGSYNIIILEAENEKELYSKARKFGNKFGGIDTFLIGGHGSGEFLRLGEGEDEEDLLGISDLDEIRGLRTLFVKNPLVILDSCLTGGEGSTIGAQMSGVLGVDLIAPEGITSIEDYILTKKGRIKDIKYKGEDATFFRNGKKLDRKPPTRPPRFPRGGTIIYPF
jgi:hypothetical protein